MDQVETLFMIQMLKHKELLREAEKDRIVQAVLKKQSSPTGPYYNIFDWAQVLSGNFRTRKQYRRERHNWSNQCCSATESRAK